MFTHLKLCLANLRGLVKLKNPKIRESSEVGGWVKPPLLIRFFSCYWELKCLDKNETKIDTSLYKCIHKYSKCNFINTYDNNFTLWKKIMKHYFSLLLDTRGYVFIWLLNTYFEQFCRALPSLK